MRFRSRGLLVASTDQGLYVPRAQLEASLLEPVLAGGSVLLTGDRGSGKTTSLRQLAADLNAHGRPTAWVNAALADSASDLLSLVARALSLTDWKPPTDLTTADLATAIQRLSGAPSTAILLDGPLPNDTGRTLFGRLRDEVWELPHQWAVTSPLLKASQLRLPPADAFWDRVVAMPPLTASEVDELIYRGLEPNEASELRLSDWGPPSIAWPREVIRSIRATVVGQELEAPDEVARLNSLRAGLDRLPAMILAELEALGRPAAANDEELLRRLGYTRAYVARGLAELEQGGLVTANPESTDGRSGRPRKLYEPVLSGIFT